MQVLFVYGTLRNGFNNPIANQVKDALRYIGKGFIFGRLFEIDKYPGFVESSTGYPVHGEIYELLEPEKTLQVLDAYEACADSFPEPHEYTRKKIEIIVNGNKRLIAWMYVYNFNTEGKEEILTGDYAAFTSRK